MVDTYDKVDAVLERVAAALCLKSGNQAVQDVDVAQLVSQVREAGSFV